jgi:hypothetical protein
MGVMIDISKKWMYSNLQKVLVFILQNKTINYTSKSGINLFYKKTEPVFTMFSFNEFGSNWLSFDNSHKPIIIIIIKWINHNQIFLNDFLLLFLK